MNPQEINDYIQGGLAANDCSSITEWLQQLSEEYDVPLAEVKLAAQLLGPQELFDGLPAHLSSWGGE